MKKIWFYLIIVMLLVSCSDEIPENPAKTEGRTLLAYIVSNNNPNADLDRFLKANVVDMYKGLSASKESKTLLVYYRPKIGDKSLESPSILKYVTDGKGKINGRKVLSEDKINVADLVINEAEIHPYENHVATDPKVMVRVLQDMVKLAPSDSYGLTMGSHGTGWLPGNPVKGRSFGDDSNYNINIPELANSLRSAFAGKQLDYVLFDACMMANAEVAYELRDVTDHIIASVLETPVYGFPYSRILSDLYSKDVDYQQICDEFIEFNRQQDAWGTCAVIDCSKMDKLAAWVKVNLAAYKDRYVPNFYKQVFQYGGPYFRNYSYDVVDVFRQLKGEEPTDLQFLMTEVVIAKNCLEGPLYEFGGVVIDKNRFSGMGMYLPFQIRKSSWDSYFISSLAWAKAVEWNNYHP